MFFNLSNEMRRFFDGVLNALVGVPGVFTRRMNLGQKHVCPVQIFLAFVVPFARLNLHRRELVATFDKPPLQVSQTLFDILEKRINEK